MYFLIGGWGGERRWYATLKFFLYTMAGSALMLIGILYLAGASSRSGTGFTFNLLSLHGVPLTYWEQIGLFIALAVLLANIGAFLILPAFMPGRMRRIWSSLKLASTHHWPLSTS